jgi:hypothetical protein
MHLVLENVKRSYLLYLFSGMGGADGITSGPLRIYRAPGSVAFLNCSNALQPILPKSQCWEVEVLGIFVLQIRRPQYWRIELPNKTTEERVRAEELKEVLGKVLMFEKTPCPFRRSFTVDLPEAPKTPVKKRPWRPVQRPKLDSSPLLEDEQGQDSHFEHSASATNPSPTAPFTEAIFSPSALNYIASETTATSSLAKAQQICQGSVASSRKSLSNDLSSVGPPSTLEPPKPPPSTGTLAPSVLEDSDGESLFGVSTALEEDIETKDKDITPRSRFQPNFQPLTLELDQENLPRALQNCSRSITAPPVLSLVTSPPSKHRTSSPLRNSTAIDSDSEFSSSVDSFHSVQSWHSPLAPPSPPASGPSSPTSTYPYPHNNIVLPKRPQHTRDASELTVTPETPRVWDIASTTETESVSRSLSPPPKTPTLVNDASERSDEEQFEVVTPPTIRSNIRHRATTSSNSRRRALSPLPAAVNLFSPRQRSRRLQTARHLPTAIIQKTCEILLSPPSHLLHLMLNIASKIAAGEWRGVLSGHGEAVHWDFEDEYAGDGWAEDDYGISLPNPQTKVKKPNTSNAGGSWEVD